MTNYYDEKFMLAAIRKVEPLNLFFRQRIFKKEEKFPEKFVTVEYQRLSRKLAPYTSSQFGGVAVEREGYEVRTYQTPLLLPMGVITDDTIAQKLLGESPYNSGISPDERAAEIMSRDMARLLDRIQLREEFMCAKCLEDGKIEIIGTGVNDVVDYGFKNIETCTSADKWTSGYDVIGKLSKIATQVRKTGSNPDMLVLGTDAANALLSNSKLYKLLDMRSVDVGEINPSKLEDGVQYLGRFALPGLVCHVYSYDKWYEDDQTRTMKPVMTPTTAMLLSEGSGAMLYGGITYIDSKRGEYVTTMEKYMPYTDYRVNPPVKELFVQSRPLPMPYDLESWYVLKEVV